MGVARIRVGLLATVLALAALPLTACLPFSTACPAVGYVSAISISIAPERIVTLDPDSLEYRACQDGACREAPLQLGPRLVSAPLPPSASPRPPASGPALAFATPPQFTASPAGLTVSGTTVQGESVGPLHVTITPKVDYPDGPTCGQRITAAVRWDLSGLHQLPS
ncbi:hypothetical protein SPF06_08710 [Sinomonas sp. JGH33]|uniref:Lipoprotein n=1 Tax=Sinomonas terricola TaxID=3110330 RepID=A0ABU5T548_9MICC|nr:hypothetical protein [Sinomonas sp. JGH33]MEA5454800.1 hypothetical protein [Sinomonas sp. JGH33]